MIYTNSLNYMQILTIISCYHVIAVPEFRVLAPQIICPKQDNISMDKADFSVIIIKPTSHIDLQLLWAVRWTPLPFSSQREVLNLWKIIRDLEKKLNEQTSTEYVYIIRNNELISGVTYVFNLTARSSTGVTAKSFNIIYEAGSQTIKDIQINAEKFSVMMLGGQSIFCDLEYTMKAEVTTCTDTEDYNFSWSVYSVSDRVVNVSHIKGSRLEIPAHTLTPGVTYVVNCEIKTYSSDDFITDKSLTLSVLRRKLIVYLNIDELILPVNQAVMFEALIVYEDFPDYEIKYEWECTSRGKVCDFLQSFNNRTLNLSLGFPEEGKYEIILTVSVLGEVAKAYATIKALNAILPLLQIEPINRCVNENQEVFLKGEASNLTPSCILTWYFASKEYLASADPANDTRNIFLHGEAISEPITLNSIEENFIYEYIDFTNETLTRRVEARMIANAGRARLVAECNCSVSFECEAQGVSYGDLYLQLNESPKIYNFTIYPDSGSALKTLFRVSASVTDINEPLRFSFYCLVDNQTLLLASYLDHSAVESILPYRVDGIDIWVEVCDTLGACSKSESITITLHPSEVDINKLANKTRAHMRRCEILDLTYTSVSTVRSLSNGQEWEQLKIYTRTLLETLPELLPRCALSEYRYTDFVNQLDAAGVDTTQILK